MAQHFLLTSKARSLSPIKIAKLSDDETLSMLSALRWESDNRFLLLVRDFSLRVKLYQIAIRYHVKPDEIYDLTKISQRVYGRRDEYLVVMAVAGLSTMDQPIEVQTLVFPTEEQLALLKQQVGFNNDAVKRLFTKK